MRRALVVLFLVLAACSSDDDSAAPEATTTAQESVATTTATAVPSYEPVAAEAACDDEVPADPSVECGVLTVPVDRTDPDGGDVTIPYAVLRSPDPQPLPDPIIYFSGGPGGDGRGIADFMLEIGIAGGAHDVIVFDQRGTGASTPSLDCAEVTDAVWALLGSAAAPADELAIVDGALADCRARLLDEGIDLDAYDTPTTAADVEDLRVALGIDEWNLFGVSYGTTVALEVLRQHPETVRAAVLDSAYPTDQATDPDAFVAQASRALGVLAQGCAADASCVATHGDMAAGLQAVFDAWNADPYETTVEDPEGGEPHPLTLTGADIVAGIWNAMYDDELIPLLPSIPAALLARDAFAEVVVQQFATEGIETLTGSAEGITNSVDCADRGRLVGRDRESVLAEEPFYGGIISLGFQNCELWDVAPVDAAFNEPVVSDVPALLLGDEYDPVTPPEDTEHAAEGFANGTYVHTTRLGHGTVFNDRCPTSLLLAFFDDPTAPVDTACVDAMGPPAWAL